jgi:hypothetical protein
MWSTIFDVTVASTTLAQPTTSDVISSTNLDTGLSPELQICLTYYLESPLGLSTSVPISLLNLLSCHLDLQESSLNLSPPLPVHPINHHSSWNKSPKGILTPSIATDFILAAITPTWLTEVASPIFLLLLWLLFNPSSQSSTLFPYKVSQVTSLHFPLQMHDFALAFCHTLPRLRLYHTSITSVSFQFLQCSEPFPNFTHVITATWNAHPCIHHWLMPTHLLGFNRSPRNTIPNSYPNPCHLPTHCFSSYTHQSVISCLLLSIQEHCLFV